MTTGLTVRGLGGLLSGPASPASRLDTMVGALLIVLSALSYSLLGVAYEWLVQMAPGRLLSQAQVGS